MLESITIREAFLRSRACGGERERVAERVIQREREDPSEEESRETFSERNQRHKVSENQRGFRDKRE